MLNFSPPGADVVVWLRRSRPALLIHDFSPPDADVVVWLRRSRPVDTGSHDSRLSLVHEQETDTFPSLPR